MQPAISYCTVRGGWHSPLLARLKSGHWGCWAWESRGQLCILTETADGERGLWVFSDSDFKKSVGLLTLFLFLSAPLLSAGAGLPGLP